MGELHLDADWDRDGRLTGEARERAAAGADPGLVLLANLDVDGRVLPGSVTAGSPQVLDVDQKATPRGDDDPAPVRVTPDKPKSGAGLRVTLVLPEEAETSIRPKTPAGRPMLGLHRGGGVVVFPITGVAVFTIEAFRLRASPLQAASSATVSLRWEDATGAVSGSEDGVVTVAPLILVGDLAPPERLYMCVDEGENDPSIVEVRVACGQAGVAFLGVPPAVHGGDAWVQDQFQQGFCQAPGRTMRVLLHLPRVMGNATFTQYGPNLSGFVASHFPSTGLGLCADFWQRTFSVVDTAGRSHQLAFADSGPLLYAMARAAVVFQTLFFQLGLVEAMFSGTMPTTFSEFRKAVPVAMADLAAAVAAAKGKPTWQNRGTILDQRVTAARALVTQLDSKLPLQGGGVGLPLSASTVVPVAFDEADVLDQRLSELHDSVNFGGNIEVGPGDAKAPAGKILVGEEPTPPGGGTARKLDAELFAFLRGQRRQPVVTIDTGWLDVGHVDELVAFVPDRSASSGAAIVRASPGVATAILGELQQRFVGGLSQKQLENFSPYHYSGQFDRRTMKGTFPVTHLLRGKYWLHSHHTDDVGGVEPPRIYVRLVNADQASPVVTHHLEYQPGIGPDRRYPANISIFEVLDFDGDVNATIEQDKLPGVDKVLAAEFPQCKVIGVPVLFDYSPDLSVRRTTAFTPDLVNLQVLGNRLVIPRPYGPRVPLAAAADVLRTVLPDERRGRATAAALTGKGLHVTVHWARSSDLQGQDDMVLADQFRDGFPGKSQADVAKVIVAANPSEFASGGRQLRDGWRRLVIPENTVDVFQAYTALVLEPLGVAVSWVDSWYYHVRFGGIHCGTNLLRRVVPPAVPWWRQRPLPDTS